MSDPAEPGQADAQTRGGEYVASRRPSLLPAFEPLSSSPGLPRPSKRKLDDILEDRKYYPTPIPTSSTAVLASSPSAYRTRPAFQRTVSTLSERAPLGDVPTLDLPANGEPVLMGRSSNSSDYQLSANRHISRVHVRASYHAPSPGFTLGRVEVECLGWNGAKVHCKGEIISLAKEGVFVSDKPMAQIIVDVQDTRVMLIWPKEDAPVLVSPESKSSTSSASPSKRPASPLVQLPSSPPPYLPPHPRSPESPTPANNFGDTFSSTFHAEETDESAVKVYEDEDPLKDVTPLATASSPSKLAMPSTEIEPTISQVTAASSPEEFSEHDEENDPVIHSFGPFGENILARFQSFQPTSPDQSRTKLDSSHTLHSSSSAAQAFNPSPVKNHVINQLAFSRVHSTPLSTIHSNLPAELRGAMAKPSDTENRRVLTTSELKTILDEIPCVGEISREGKDAAGKLLESEFYYMPENDTDEMRRITVTQSVGKSSIRAARKQHKQYYWKRPRH